MRKRTYIISFVIILFIISQLVLVHLIYVHKLNPNLAYNISKIYSLKAGIVSNGETKLKIDLSHLLTHQLSLQHYIDKVGQDESKTPNVVDLAWERSVKDAWISSLVDKYELIISDDAIEKYKALHPEIVTMDITMPSTNGIEDGIEALSDIIKYDQKAKVIMITSHGEQDKIIGAIQSGASNYIMKPLNLENTQEIILKTLSKSQTTLGRKFKRL